MENKINRNSHITLQQQLYLEILNSIKTGKYKKGDQIPSEHSIAKIYGISRVTARNSLKQLVDEGYLIKKHGKGTFVKDSIHLEPAFEDGSFTTACLKMNKKPSTKIISIKKTLTNNFTLENLECNEIIEIIRVRYVNDVPCIVEIDYFPDTFNFLFEQDLNNISIMSLVAKKLNVIPKMFEDRYQIINSNKKFSKLLNCKEKTPLLEVSQKILSEQRKIIYINKQYILTTKYIYATLSTK